MPAGTGKSIAKIDVPSLPPSKMPVSCKTPYRKLATYNLVYSDGLSPYTMYIPGNAVYPRERKEKPTLVLTFIRRTGILHTM